MKKILDKVKGFGKGLKSEWKAIQWPTREKLIRATIAVAIVCTVVTGGIYLWDGLIKWLVNLVVG